MGMRIPVIGVLGIVLLSASGALQASDGRLDSVYVIVTDANDGDGRGPYATAIRELALLRDAAAILNL